MSQLMLKKNIKPLKAFLWVDEGMGANLQLKNPENPHEPYTWTLHIAPVVMVKLNGKSVPYIIDPSAEDKAVPFDEWKKKLTAHNPKKYKKYIHSEIGRTGQFLPGSPDSLDKDYSDSKTMSKIDDDLKKMKVYEQSSSGVNDYLGDEMWRRDDEEGKLDAMSGGK
jgi:hypothetical protein